MPANKYRTTIGIECHVQLKTKTKLFAAVGNEARDAEPNSLISHICLGMPGALPVLNEKVVEMASEVAYLLNTKPQKYSYFERKHYFYPDLPKGYQITQLSKPIIIGGHLDIETGGRKTRVQINRVQIEEDAGKTTHPSGKDYSLVDLNRAGTPLLEIVSEADIHSPAEAKAYARELWLLMRYGGVSDADLYHGNMRFDINVSVSKTNALGTRTETKNLNSFKSVEKAAEYEIKRQIELLEKGEKIVQETRGWDDAKQKTISQRGKENAHDYRYFPEPDVPPIELTSEYINKIKEKVPILPSEIRNKLTKINIEPSAIETLLDEMPAGIFVAKLLENNTSPEHIKIITNWLVGEILGQIGNGKLSWDKAILNDKALIKLAQMIDENKLSSTAAKTVLVIMVENGGEPENIAKENNLLQISDEGVLEDIVKKVLADNQEATEELQNGEMKVMGFLIGQVMKVSKGQANPSVAQKLIKLQLGL